MTINGFFIKRIIRRLLAAEDHGIEVNRAIADEFLKYAVGFFKRIVSAKLDNQDVTIDWYETELLSSSLPKEDVSIHAGLNMKTINNAHNTTRKEIVLDASIEYYHELKEIIKTLIEQNDVDISLTIKFQGVSVDLNIKESLIVINTLAVKQSAINGGMWSTVGKQVEKPLMITLCALFQVPTKYYDQKDLPDSVRESDFYLFDPNRVACRCEVKLQGKGNPEGPDSAFARGSSLLVGRTLSDTMKSEMDKANIHWVELRTEDGWKKLGNILNKLSIPCQPYPDHRDLQEDLENILTEILSDDIQTSVTPIIKEAGSELLIELD